MKFKTVWNEPLAASSGSRVGLWLSLGPAARWAVIGVSYVASKLGNHTVDILIFGTPSSRLTAHVCHGSQSGASNMIGLCRCRVSSPAFFAEVVAGVQFEPA